MLKSITLIVSIIFFQGCVKQTDTHIPKYKEEPKWLLNPYIDGDSIAAVGCSQIHFKGIEAQKNLAISRAVDRIASQNSIIIDNVTYRQLNIKDNKKTSNLKSSSLHTIENIKLSTKIKELYTKQDGEICAWVIQK